MPMETRTRFVFLMHPKEFKQEKAGTGRLTHLCLPNSEIHMGKSFEGDEDVRALIDDPRNYCVLLYPGKEALNLSEVGRTVPGLRSLGEGGPAEPTNTAQPEASPYRLLAALRSELGGGRRLVVFILDATWSGARKMLRLSPCLQKLPRIMFTPAAPSRFVIKQQPTEGCLSTLEATHELLTVFARLGIDQYPLPEQLLGIFAKMQDFQIKCAADPTRGGYRRKPYKDPSERVGSHGRSGSRRKGYMKTGSASA